MKRTLRLLSRLELASLSLAAHVRRVRLALVELTAEPQWRVAEARGGEDVGPPRWPGAARVRGQA